jgi:hypothetical protein
LLRSAPLAALLLAACAVSALAAPRAQAPAPRVVTAAVEGSAVAGNPARSTISLAEARAVRGPRTARRAVGALRRLAVGIAPSTVLVTEEEDGYRERVERDDLFAILDDAGEALPVEASGRLTIPRAGRGRATLAARRVIVHLPPADEGDDPYADDVEGLPDDPPFDEEPVIDPDDPDLGDDPGI